MSACLSEGFPTIAPTEADAQLAPAANWLPASGAGEPASAFRVLDDHEPETIALAASALRLLQHILTEIAQGNAVTMIPIDAERTTQQAADLLNASRPFVVGLL